jgi:hypothetical protein
MLNYIVTANSITILIKNRPEIIDKTHPNFEKVEIALKAGADETDILHLMNISKAIVHFGQGNVQVEHGEIKYKGEIVHSALGDRILALMEKGFDITPFTNFMENLYLNPSQNSINELYGFLEACNLPITEDGHFLSYKKITANYLDCYTKTIDNSIGARPSMPREKVNSNSSQTCSHGLHVASYSYMKSYSGDRIVVCKVNPKDVVAVPNDYNNAKMRVCEYEVINEVGLNGEEITANAIKDEEAYSKEYGKKTQKEIDEPGFIKSLRDYLGTHEADKWNEITKFFEENGITNISGTVKVSLELKDDETMANVINEYSKRNEINREKLLKFLNI